MSIQISKAHKKIFWKPNIILCYNVKIMPNYNIIGPFINKPHQRYKLDNGISTFQFLTQQLEQPRIFLIFRRFHYSHP